MMRKLFFQILVNEMSIYQIIGSRVYERGSVPTQPQKPFVVTRFLESNRGPAIRVEDRLAEVWAYGPENDYTTIDKLLFQVNLAVDRRSGVYHDEPGLGRFTLIEGRWQGTGPDLEDPDYRGTLKVATYRLVGSWQ